MSNDKKGHWVLYDSDIIAAPSTAVEGLADYKKEAAERIPLGSVVPLSQPEVRDGMRRTMFLSNLSLGYAYADEKALLNSIDLANQTNVERVVIGGGVHGPYLFRDNVRRLTLDPEYKSLDSQLRRLHQLMDTIKAPEIVYVTNENDKKICTDLFSLYQKEHKKRETGHATIGLSVAAQKEERNSRYDDAKRIINTQVYPYLLRMGSDEARLTDDETLESNIVDLVEAFGRMEAGRRPWKKDRQLIKFAKTKDSKRFKVFGQYSDSSDDIKLRVFGNTQYSDETQYKMPSLVIEEWAKMAQNGGITKLPEDILVDMRQAHQMFRVVDGKAIMHVPDMVDDQRYFDNNFSNPMAKSAVSDRVHKRATIIKQLNYPGANIMSGDIRELEETGRAYLEFTFPRVYELMEEVQKTGKGKRKISAFITHDNQLASLTERVRMMVNAYDYAFAKRGCTYHLGIGDRLHGRQYSDMPNENAQLKGQKMSTQQRTFVNLMRPFFTMPQIEYWLETQGNHEWDTDRWGATNYLIALETAIQQHLHESKAASKTYESLIKKIGPRAAAKLDPSLYKAHEMVLDVPDMFIGPDGDVGKGSWGFVDINGYGIIMHHKFYASTGSKGGGERNPTEEIGTWMRGMQSWARPYDMGFMGHLHQEEMKVRDNKFLGIMGCTAGESGYELERKYKAKPMQAILDFYEDGHFGVELITEKFLTDGYKPAHPELKGDTDKFIKDCMVEDVNALFYKEGPVTKVQTIHPREIRYKPGHKAR